MCADRKQQPRISLNKRMGTLVHPAPGSDWRYSLVAVTSSSSARYSEIKRFSDGAPDLTFDISELPRFIL
jgi:hypothetical protein